jgi:hypothetical protein
MQVNAWRVLGPPAKAKSIKIAVARSPGRQIPVVAAPRGRETALRIPMRNADHAIDSNISRNLATESS